jgi:hypothetical protein
MTYISDLDWLPDIVGCWSLKQDFSPIKEKINTRNLTCEIYIMTVSKNGRAGQGRDGTISYDATADYKFAAPRPTVKHAVAQLSPHSKKIKLWTIKTNWKFQSELFSTFNIFWQKSKTILKGKARDSLAALAAETFNWICISSLYVRIRRIHRIHTTDYRTYHGAESIPVRAKSISVKTVPFPAFVVTIRGCRVERPVTRLSHRLILQLPAWIIS